MKTKVSLLVLTASIALLPNVAYAAITITSSSSSTTSLAYTGQTSSTDLINAGQSTFSSATVSATANEGVFPGAAINDGNYSTTNSHNTYFISPTNFPATATYNLNVSMNTLGYDITSVKSFMGFATVSAAQANQTYTIDLSFVGSALFTTYGTVSYKPFGDVDQAIYESFVSVTDSSGLIASGVDAIRFTFTDPIGLLGVTNGTGTNEGTVIREIDVIGTATIPEPSVALLGGLSVLSLLRRRR